MLKHVGRMISNSRKVVVAYKVVPNEPENAFVVTTENLMAEEHDTLMTLLESPAGQEAEDLATAMARTPLPDGRNMLSAFHTTGKMVKVPTNSVEMTPNNQTKIRLSELNEIIAEQRGVTVADLSLGNTAAAPAETKINEVNPVEAIQTEVLSDEDLAKQYRSQADALYKEAAELRRQAEELAPTKKKSATKKTENSV